MADRAIGLCGFARDGHLAALADALARRGATSLVLLPLPWGRYAWREGRYFYGHRSLDHVAAFFVRQTYVPIFDLIERRVEAVDPLDWMIETVRMQNNAAFLRAFFAHFESRGCVLVNPFSAGEHMKHRQGETAARCGWRVPRTFVTNSPGEALAMIGSGDFVIKPAAGGTLVSKIDRQATARLAAIDLPVVIQEYIPGDDVRAYVIEGEVVAAARIATGALDYRRDPAYTRRMRALELPRDVRDRAAAVMERHRLVSGSMDLRLTPEGEFVFLEVNSAGSFLELQHALGIPIADRLADLLIAGAQQVALAPIERETLPLSAVVGDGAASADALFDLEAGLEPLRSAVRSLLPPSGTVEIDLDPAQQESLFASSGIRARRARLDPATHVLVPLRDATP